MTNATNDPLNSQPVTAQEYATTSAAESRGDAAEPATADTTVIRQTGALPEVAPQPFSFDENLEGRHVDEARTEDVRAIRHEVIARQKEQYGGFKFGSAFFGWIAATGTAFILTALFGLIASFLGYRTPTTSDDATGTAAADPQTVGITTAIVGGVVLLVAYYFGGYVAGRMARFDGLRQGFAVWLWGVVIAAILVAVVLIGRVNVSPLSTTTYTDAFSDFSLFSLDQTLSTIIVAIVAAVIALVGALLGGLAGMIFHRKVDRAGLGD